MAGERTPFDSIESSLEYIGLLREVIEKTRKDVEANVAVESVAGATRVAEALRLVLYKLERLDKHMEGVHRNLNDLRTLRRLLLRERESEAGEGGAQAASEARASRRSRGPGTSSRPR
jgi:hypothetical protein